MTRFLIEQWNRSKRRLPITLPEARRVTLVTSTMAQPVIEQLAEDIRQVERLEVQVLPVVNKFFGAEVTVGGLLCGQDVLVALEENDNLGDLVLLPRVMLDNEGVRFLDDMTLDEFKTRLPVRTEFVRNAQETIDAIRSLAAPGKELSTASRMALRIQAR
jgi:NifB/MoaA-like Fe-S oxidoreductase